MSLHSLSQALDSMLNILPVPQKTEILNLSYCANRICADDIFSPVNVPHFDNSAMDGYAVRIEDLTEGLTLKVAGKAFAGAPFQGEMAKGECVRIMTGAMLPRTANAVVMQEECTVNLDNSITFKQVPQWGENIRRIGEDVRKGSLILTKGSLLNVTNLPLLASLGIESVTVFTRLKVAILSTGNELVSVGDTLAEGHIYDTNRFAVRLMLEKMHCEVLDYGILPDDPASFEARFTHAQQYADVLITSGGVSVGEADFTKEVLNKLGQIHFWQLAIKPGKPFAFGRLNQTWFFGLPGNPVSALVTFYQLVQPALAKLSGLADEKRAKLTQNLTACTTVALRKSVGRQDFQRGFYQVNPKGELEVRPIGKQSSHIFSAFHESNCFIVLEQQRGNVQAGEKVTIQPFNELLK